MVTTICRVLGGFLENKGCHYFLDWINGCCNCMGVLSVVAWRTSEILGGMAAHASSLALFLCKQ